MRPTVVLLAPLVVLASKAIGLYDRDQHILRKTTIDEAPVDHLPGRALCAGGVAGRGGAVSRVLWRGPRCSRSSSPACCCSSSAAGSSPGVVAAIAAPERCLILGNGGDADARRRQARRAPGVQADGRRPPGPRARRSTPIEIRVDAAATSTTLAARDRRAARGARDHRPGRPRPGGDPHVDPAWSRRSASRSACCRACSRSSAPPRLRRRRRDHAARRAPVRPARSPPRSLKRAMDIVGAGARAGRCWRRCCLLAIAVKLDSRGPGVLPPAADRPPGRALRDAQVPLDGARRRRRSRTSCAISNEAEGGLFKIDRGPADHAGRAVPAPDLARRAAAAAQRAAAAA